MPIPLLAMEEECKHTSTRALFFVRVAQGLTRFTQVFGLQHFCARHLKKSSHRSHAMFSTLRDPPFTAPTQSTATSSSLLFPSNWTPTATPLFGRFAEQSPLTCYQIEVSSASRRDCLESSCDDLATTLVASETVERSDLERLASPLILQERETSANPFGIYRSNTESSKASFSHLRTCIGKPIARSHNKRRSSRDFGVVRDFLYTEHLVARLFSCAQFVR